MPHPCDTIAAIATAPGEAGLAVVRVSGPDALRVADTVFRCQGQPPSQRKARTLVLGRVVAGDGSTIDQAILLIMRAPRSFTGEDAVEFQCHGGRVPASMILRALLRAGCRAALPGEFTRRAFLNGRLDLSQAEAVLHLIRAHTDRAAKLAVDQLEGRLSRRIDQIYDRATEAAAMIESSLDFPEEDLPESMIDKAKEILSTCVDDCVALAMGWTEGRLIRDGIRVVIAGRPNAGKSTLFNTLVGKERAIVMPTPGTTRDSIEEWLVWNGIEVCLVDTAGIRESQCPVESAGVQRSLTESAAADIVLYLIDGQHEADSFDLKFLSSLSPKSSVIVLTKKDLWDKPTADPSHGRFRVVEFSCKDEGSRESLIRVCSEIISGMLHLGESHAILSSERHLASIRSAASMFSDAIKEIEKRPSSDLSLAALSVRRGMESLGQITGKSYTEELLDQIFSKFCIGK